MNWARCWLVSGIIVGMLGFLVPTASALELEVGAAPEFRRWAYEQSGHPHRVTQSYLPIDLQVRLDEATRIRAGADFVTSSHHGSGRTGNLDGPGEARLLCERTLWAGRVLLRADGRLALFEDAFTPREIRVAEVLELPGLSVPLPQPGTGNRFGMNGALRVAERRTWNASVAAGFEARTEFALREDGLALDPGDLIRAGGVVEQAVFRWVLRHQCSGELPGTVELEGKPAFRPGNRLRIAEQVARPLGGQKLLLDAELLLVESGELKDPLAIDGNVLRGGNRLRWGAGLLLGENHRYEIGLDATHHRGFSGPLGHSDWVTPSFTVTIPVGRGSASMHLDGSIGHAREGGQIDGIGLRLSVRQEVS